MWSRTLSGFILGLLISISVALNLNLMLPIAQDVSLLIGLLVAFPIWVTVQVWSYHFSSAKEAWLKGLMVLAPCASLSIILMLMRTFG
ncbi:MAG: hypothetical protein HRU22_14495 [Gammaproteobacteria bacterium]|nr:hypothetical protein [Gammaproteobacteria bacterium]